MNKGIIFSGIYLCSVLISSISQILLKTSANVEYENKLREYLNPRVIIAYMFFFGSTLVTVLALKYVPLSMGAILESMGYIFVTILGVILLKEKVKGKKFIGLSLIALGVIVFSI